MEKSIKPRHMKVFQEGILFHVHYLKLVKIVFMRNAKFLHPLCKKVLISMELMRMVNKRMLKALKPSKNFVIPKRATTSSNSPPHEDIKGECSRYKYAFNQVTFDYDQQGKFSHNIWRKFACSFCGLDNHNVSRCWKKITMHGKISKKRRQEAKVPLDNGNHVEKKMQLFCTHCHKQGHLVDKCSTLYPTSHPQNFEECGEKE